MKEKLFKKENLYYYLFFILISTICGINEVFSTYIYHLFTFMQTGNIVYTFIYIFNNNIDFIYNLISILIFILVIALMTYLKYKAKKSNKLKDYIYNSLITILIINIILIFIPYNLNNSENNLDLFKILYIILNTSLGAIFISSITNFLNISFIPTMMTNNLRRLDEELVNYELDKDKSHLYKVKEYLLVLFFFILGIIVCLVYLTYIKSQFNLRFENYEFNQNIVFVFNLVIYLIIFYLYKNKIKRYYEI